MTFVSIRRFQCILYISLGCVDYKYGLECNSTCGKCFDGNKCNHMTGSCPNGCDAGVFGDKCDQGKIITFWSVSLISIDMYAF